MSAPAVSGAGSAGDTLGVGEHPLQRCGQVLRPFPNPGGDPEARPAETASCEPAGPRPPADPGRARPPSHGCGCPTRGLRRVAGVRGPFLSLSALRPTPLVLCRHPVWGLAPSPPRTPSHPRLDSSQIPPRVSPTSAPHLAPPLRAENLAWDPGPCSGTLPSPAVMALHAAAFSPHAALPHP